MTALGRAQRSDIVPKMQKKKDLNEERAGMVDAQISGALAFGGVAAMGLAIPEIPHFYVLISAVMIGSAQAAGARTRRGYIKGFSSVLWAFMAGVSCGYFGGKGISAPLGWSDTATEILAAYLISILGGRLVLALALNFDVDNFVKASGDFIAAILSRK